RTLVAVGVAAACAGAATSIQAASHREAPITALDHPADITDWFAFRGYEKGREDTFTQILNVDPLLEPSNGPNYFPFDDEVVYKMNLDNNRDGVDDIVWEFRFTTEVRLPGVFTGFVGAGQGIPAPANAPTDINGNPTAGLPLIPPAITALDGAGSEGLNLRQTYTMTVFDGNGNILAGPFAADENGNPLIAVPSNVGPRTMPNYPRLARQGVYTLEGGARVFAGTVEDPFYIDLGGAFDSFNLPVPTLTAGQDADDNLIVDGARDAVSGFNVNTIALELPIANVTATGDIPAANSPDAVVGTYGSTERPQAKTFNAPGEDPSLSSDLVQIQRMGNPLFNELIIPTETKNLWSMSEPEDDAQFADFALDPLVARVLNAVFGVQVPNPPRNDLLPLVQYIPPICPGCATAGEGPIADLLRTNVGVPPVTQDDASRLGVLGGDLAGFPNGRRVFDDITDVFVRVGAGVLAGPPFSEQNARLGDGVNRNDVDYQDVDYQDVFPYVGFAQSGRDHRHVDRGEPVAGL
ncbi:MAG: DUF4331 domain-containing protein, partial [Gammaproteobacteria bacterium]